MTMSMKRKQAKKKKKKSGRVYDDDTMTDTAADQRLTYF
jgi:hypothetical protein